MLFKKLCTNNWINEGWSNWIVELIKSQCINVSTYRPISGSSCIKLPAELRSSKKRLINIKNNDQKIFLWSHVRRINFVKIHPERITQMTESLLMILIMMGLSFLCEKRILARLKRKNDIWINLFCSEKKLTFSIYVPDHQFESLMDLLLATDESKSHYAYIKDFDRFMFRKAKNKSKKWFCKSCLRRCNSKTVLTEH